jgi:4-diphosphocytidyl-2-C-methyl-D-erythritol kinase
MRITLAAPAKLNLHLEVLARRPDGFHELETVFQALALADEVEVELRPGAAGIALRCDDPGIPAGRANLAWRAAEAFCADGVGDGIGIAIALAKRIPHGAGLGGGSSDAATVLRALARLLPGRRTPADLQALAARLGSDVPFFLRGGLQLGHGRGEVLEPLPDLPPRPVTVLMPEAVTLPTPAVFAALTDDERGPRPPRGGAWFRQALAADGGVVALLHNRLTAPAVRLCPAVGVLLRWLGTRGVPHLMSGSGAACFALGHLDPPPGVRAWRTRSLPAHLH